MQKNNSDLKNSLVGFFPLFFNLAETGGAVLIAKEYMKMGGRAIFFSHGGEYEYLAEEIGCKVIKVKPFYDDEFLDSVWKYIKLETLKNPFSKTLEEFVQEEIKAYKRTNVDLIVSTNNFPCVISARVENIPLICVTPKVIFNFTKYPDSADILLTRLLPEFIKLRLLNIIAPKIKMWVGPFTKLAKKYNVPVPRYEYDLVKGDVTLYVNYPDLIRLDNTKISKNEIFTGPLILDELFKRTIKNIDVEKEENEIEKHLRRKGRSILFSFGSSGYKETYLKVLGALNKTDYNVIAVYDNIVKENELPEVNENILLKKFVPSIMNINKKVDLAILHGGQGTVFTAAYSGKPVIGFPMQFEQHLNLEILSRKGTAIIASRKNFKEQTLLKYIREIFDNYDRYLMNSKKLAESLPPPDSHVRCARFIADYIKQKK